MQGNEDSGGETAQGQCNTHQVYWVVVDRSENLADVCVIREKEMKSQN